MRNDCHSQDNHMERYRFIFEKKIQSGKYLNISFSHAAKPQTKQLYDLF